MKYNHHRSSTWEKKKRKEISLLKTYFTWTSWDFFWWSWICNCLVLRSSTARWYLISALMKSLAFCSRSSALKHPLVKRWNDMMQASQVKDKSILHQSVHTCCLKNGWVISWYYHLFLMNEWLVGFFIIVSYFVWWEIDQTIFFSLLSKRSGGVLTGCAVL